MATHRTKMLIIGSGPAGLSAAIYGARAMMEPIVVQGLQPGGQLTITTDVENYPGFKDVVQGPWLMQEMQAQAEHVGTRMMWDTIVSVDVENGSPFRAVGDSGDEYIGETLVIATGASAKWLGAPGEQELGGKGVSACAATNCVPRRSCRNACSSRTRFPPCGTRRSKASKATLLPVG